MSEQKMVRMEVVCRICNHRIGEVYAAKAVADALYNIYRHAEGESFALRTISD